LQGGQIGTGQQGVASIPPGAILVVPGPLSFTMLRQAAGSGIMGIIASSIATRDLEGFLRTDLIQLLNADSSERMQAHFPPLRLVFREGLGNIAMPTRVINLLSHYQGQIVLLAGTLSVSQGIFPELVISLPLKEVQQHWQPIKPDLELTLQAQV